LPDSVRDDSVLVSTGGPTQGASPTGLPGAIKAGEISLSGGIPSALSAVLAQREFS